jgi:hypothetical protein
MSVRSRRRFLNPGGALAPGKRPGCMARSPIQLHFAASMRRRPPNFRFLTFLRQRPEHFRCGRRGSINRPAAGNRADWAEADLITLYIRIKT